MISPGCAPFNLMTAFSSCRSALRNLEFVQLSWFGINTINQYDDEGSIEGTSRDWQTQLSTDLK